ncbi:acyltransferase family protein [Yersinia intermedia]|nr:acyltransferase family protein [Yersinia intermedia]
MAKPSPHLSHPKYRPDIDGLRAIAVLSVVAFHAFPDWMKGGFIGVDIFFVISGFLISTIIFENLDIGTFSFSEFYARRIRRIFPGLLLVLIASFVFGWFALLADEYKQLGKHIAAGAGFISNLVLWSEAGYFDNSAEVKPLLHLWSLGIEEQFYIIWPLVLWFAWKKKFNFITLTIVVALASFALNIKGIKNDPLATFYSPQTRFWELLSGSILAWCTLYKKNSFAKYKLKIGGWFSKVANRESVEANGRTLSNAFSVVGCLFLVFGFLQITKDVSFPGAWAVIPVLGAVLIIMAGPKAWINRKILSNKIIVWFGLMSFPLYLWHWPLLVFPRLIIGEEIPLGFRLVMIAVAIFLAWLTFKFIEAYFRHGNNSFLKVTTLLVCSAIMGMAGFYVYRANGLPARPAIQSFAQFGWGDDTRDALCIKKYGRAEFCRLSKDAKPTVVIIGDSISWQLYFGLAKETSGTGDTVLSLGQGGCAGFLGFSQRDDFKDCGFVTQKSLNAALNENSVKTVVFSAYPRYFNGSEMTINFGLDSTTNKKIESEKEFLEYVDKSFSNVILSLLAKGKQVVFVKNNPAISFDPKSCIGRPFRAAERASCSESRVTFDNSDKKYSELIDSILTKFPKVKVFDLSKMLCDSESCYAMRDGKILYRDILHLSIDGSEYVGSSLYDLINADTGNSGVKPLTRK